MAGTKQPEKRSAWRHQAAARSGMGAQSFTPRKPAGSRDRRAFICLGRAVKRQQFAGLWATLLGAESTSNVAEGSSQHEVEEEDTEMTDEWVDELITAAPPPLPSPSPPPPVRASSPFQVFVATPTRTALPVHKAWEALLPRLEEPFSNYRHDSHGRIQPIIPDTIHHECSASCSSFTLEVQCLYPTRKDLLSF
ncbi:hypothetical protein C8R45DRAFT_1108226 [Mycena sanguinolenta]|nr:hypothetical protein C8R45DRAFT_1108226 [Mycena sanguinolenta]